MREPPPEILIAGAGPGGAVLAFLLAREGRSVTVLDRATFPRPKACGESLNPGGVAALRRLGLDASVNATSPARMRGWELRSPGGVSAVAEFGEGGGEAWGIARARLDTTLVEAARTAGARIVEGVTVLGCEVAGRGGRPPRLHARDRKGESLVFEASVVVGADGLTSPTAGSLGWRHPPRPPKKASLSFRVRGKRPDPSLGSMLLGGTMTLGLAPVTRDGTEWNATLVLCEPGPSPTPRMRRMGTDPESLLLESIEQAGFDWTEGPEIVGGPWASGSFHRPTRRVAGPGVLLVGDAAGYYDPLTGQGISRAIRGAELAADAIQGALALPIQVRGFPGYAKALERLVGPTRTVQRLIETVVSRPRLREAALEALAARPEAASLMVRVTGDLDAPGALGSLRTFGSVAGSALFRACTRHPE